jgi:hypothetical protein
MILEKQATDEGRENFWPLFSMDPTPDGIRFVGEDVHFFKRLREAGIPIYLDHGLSLGRRPHRRANADQTPTP